jgi:hypothetical protein
MRAYVGRFEALLAFVAFIALSVRRSAFSEYTLVACCVCVNFASRAILFTPFTFLTVSRYSPPPSRSGFCSGGLIASSVTVGALKTRRIHPCVSALIRGSFCNKLESLFYVSSFSAYSVSLRYYLE